MNDNAGMVRITNRLIKDGASMNGGWSEEQLALLGVSWPPKKGWKGRIIGRWISAEQAARFLWLKDRHLIPEGTHTRD